jgi:hypothetical protein
MMTEIQPGDRILVGHAAREAQRIGDGFFVRRVVPEARAAERGTERGVVDRDDAAIAGALVGAEDELFVAELGDRVENLHYRKGRSQKAGIRREELPQPLQPLTSVRLRTLRVR